MSKSELGTGIGVAFSRQVANRLVASQSAMLALTDVSPGQIVIREDDGYYNYLLKSLPANNLSNWQPMGKDASPIGESVADIITTNENLSTKPDGLYAIAGLPLGGLPSGVALGDIVQKTGVVYTIAYTFSNAPATIYSNSDQKTYNKKTNGAGNPTWEATPIPTTYPCGVGFLYPTFQAAIDACAADFLSGAATLGIIDLNDRAYNEDALIPAIIQNLHIRGIGTKYRANTQVSRITILGHRVTLQNILLTNTAQTPLVINSSGTVTESGTPNVGRGKHVLDQVTFSTSQTNAIDVQACDNFLIFNNCDFDSKVINIGNKTGTATSITIDGCNNGILNLGNNRVATKNNSLSVYRGTISSTGTILIDVDAATPIAYSILRSYSALGASIPVALGTLIINDDVGRTLQTLKCTTAYTIAAALGIGTAIDLSKYQVESDGLKQNIVRTSSSVVVNAASFTIPTATIDANEALDINNSFGANAVVTLATPTGNSKKDILLSIDNGSFNFSIGSNYTAKAGMVILARFNGTAWRYFASENAKQDKVRTTLNIANQATNYTIPTADIDNYQAFEIAQTTAGIVFSLGTPTGNAKKDIQIKATSTADLYINSTTYTLKAGRLANASFNGTSWNILVGANDASQVSISGTFTPTNSSIVSGDNVKSALEKAQGQIDHFAFSNFSVASPIYGDSIIFENMLNAIATPAVFSQAPGSTNEIYLGATILSTSGTGYNNTAGVGGHIITIPTTFNTVWVRVIGGRDSAIELDKFNGVSWTTVGRRQYYRGSGTSRTFSPAGSFAKFTINRDYHAAWLPLYCPDSLGGTYMIRFTNNNPSPVMTSSSNGDGRWMSGFAITKNNKGLAYTQSLEVYWRSHGNVTPLLNGATWGNPPTFNAFDGSVDIYNNNVTDTFCDFSLPQIPNGKDKLFWMILYGDSDHSAPKRLQVNNQEVATLSFNGGENFIQWLEMQKASVVDIYKNLNFGFAGLIGCKVPAAIMGNNVYSHCRLNWTGAGSASYFSDIGTLDLI